MNCEKLQIAPCLVGRDHEIELVRDAYRQVRNKNENDDPVKQVTAKSIYVEGRSGTGKSALVEAALKEHVKQDQGWYIEGKFDQMKNCRPFSALMDALNSLCLQAISLDLNQETVTNSNVDCRTNTKNSTNKILPFYGQEIQKVLTNHEENARSILMTLVPNLSQLLQTMEKYQLVHHRSSEEPVLFANRPAMTDGFRGASQASFATAGSESRGLMRHVQIKLRALIIDILQVIAKDKCIVLLIEDLQWGDIDTLNLILYLVNNVNSKIKLLFVGTFRTESSLGLRDHYLWTQIQNNNNKQTNVKTAGTGNEEYNSPSPQVVSLSSLSLDHVTTFVASTLQIKNESKVLPLSELIYERTNGNILFVHQYLHLLHSNGHIYYSHESLSWKWEDVATIQDSGPLVEGDLIAIIEAKIEKLPRNTIEALQLASCLGGRFDLDAIEFIAQRWWEENPSTKTPVTGDDEGDDIACILWPAVEIELLEEVGVASFAASSQYKFTHDKIQSAAYEMLGEQEKRKCHLCVGNCLEELYQDPSGQLWMLILAANNLFKAMDPSTSSQESCDRAAAINYNAALELKANASFESAAVMTQNALDLVGDGDESWSRNYQLSLDIHNLRAEMEFCTGRLDKCEESVSSILKHARDQRDKYDAYDLRVGSLIASRKHDEALESSLLFLRQMNFGRFPAKVTPVHVLVEIFRALHELKGLDDDALLNRPNAEDEDAGAAMRAMMKGVVVAYFTSNKLEMIFLSMRVLRISLKYGYTPHTPTAFVLCGLVHGKIGKLKEAYRLGRIGMQLSEQIDAPDATLLCRLAYYLFLDHLYNECADYTSLFTQLHDTGMETVNIPIACILGGLEISLAWYGGVMHLDSVIALGSQRLEEQIEHEMWTFVPSAKLVKQKALNLAGRSRDPTFLEGDEIKDFSEFLRQNAKDSIAQLQQWWACLEVATWFGDIKRGESMAKKISKSWKLSFPAYITIWMAVFRGLMWCWVYNEKKISVYKKRARQELRILRGWVKDGLKNRDCFLLFLEAEYLALDRGKPSTGDSVKDAYGKTLERMSNYGLPHVTALVAERAGRSLKRLYPKNDERVNRYLRASLDGYKLWGARGKVDQLVQDFGDCLNRDKES